MTHRCTKEIYDNWVYWKCTDCSFEKKLNLETFESVLMNDGDPVSHITELPDNLLNIEFHGENNIHVCTTYTEGDEIVFKCPKCDTYERRYNWKSGAMWVNKLSEGYQKFRHCGNAIPGVEKMSGLTKNLDEN